MLSKVIQHLESQVEGLLQRQQMLQAECATLASERDRLRRERDACCREIDRIVTRIDLVLKESE